MKPSEIIEYLIEHKIINSGKDLNFPQKKNLESEEVRTWVAKKIITPEQAINLTYSQRNSLASERVRAYIS